MLTAAHIFFLAALAICVVAIEALWLIARGD
jgi:hypothetical protein